MSEQEAADGLPWLTAILQRFPELKAIVLSNSNDPANVNGALQAGAVAYVVKKAHPDDLAVAVRQAFEHSIYLRSSANMGEVAAAELQLDHPDLTRRELEILRLVAGSVERRSSRSCCGSRDDGEASPTSLRKLNVYESTKRAGGHR